MKSGKCEVTTIETLRVDGGLVKSFRARGSLMDDDEHPGRHRQINHQLNGDVRVHNLTSNTHQLPGVVQILRQHYGALSKNVEF